MKSSTKYFGLAVGPQTRKHSQNGEKPTSLITALKKKETWKPKTKKFFSLQTRRLLRV